MIRPFLQDAAIALEETARRNEYKPDWLSHSVPYLQLLMNQEIQELHNELDRPLTAEDTIEQVEARIRFEALDVALCALMLWHKAGGSQAVNRGREVAHG